ncbi:PDZ domain-containing protein [Halovenus sp. WSH3]|uniref:PDZ domain-containing protein n=1 Tax=Halovenus carboxidivorans TaxID=2692199 RepID=A0A6B0T4R6_9EURY|nr:trypsin-like peptidase domain-containing protein [Halovenus carboxidivorans]MXR53125.1 PDZ domain-containing protein [Halovenus carboxidivorans]
MPEKRQSRRRFLTASGVALTAALAGCTLNPPQGSGQESSNNSGFPDDPVTPQTQEEIPASSQFSEVYQETIDSVAAVRATGASSSSGGTAWVYDDSHLVTNAHVVRDATEIYLRFRQSGWLQAELVGSDGHSDLAVLQADLPDSATPLELTDQPHPVGTRVAALGNPFGLTGSFTTGIISGRNRTISIPNSRFSTPDGIQTDAAVNPGNSGGPLITLDGVVVGVVNATQGDNVGFAISAAMVRRVVPELIETGNYDHSYLGIALSDVTPALIEANDFGNYTFGVYVNGTAPDGPSDGILQGSETTTTIRGREVEVGGDLIVRMGEWTIQNRERLSAYLALETRPGDTVDIEVVRDGETRTVQVTLGTRPEL